MSDPMDVLAPEHRRLRIGGAWRDAAGGATFAVEDPATGKTIAEVADAGVEDGIAALDAASKAMAEWAATPPRKRSELLTATYQALTERSEEVARLITLEMGKPLAEARGEVAYGAEFFRWFAEEAVRVEGRYNTAPAGGYRILTVPKPVGPCVFVTPWNFPLAMGARKIAPALAAGCTTITKPAAQTPLTMLLLARVMEEVGVPPGVVNVVTTEHPGEVVSALLADRRTRKLSFTGSTEVGRVLLRQAADNVLRTSMELGGNAALIVCADADLDVAVDGAMVAKMRNIGESCIAANRIYVEEPVCEEFTARFAKRMSALSMGHGLEDGVDVGALIDDASVTKIDDLVTDAVDRGARALGGWRAPGRAGPLLPPDGPRRRARRCPAAGDRDLRPGGADHVVHLRRRGDGEGQRHPARAGRIRLHPRPPARAPVHRGARDRDARHQSRSDLGPFGAVRGREAVRDRQGGLARGHLGVPGRHLRSDRPAGKALTCSRPSAVHAS